MIFGPMGPDPFALMRRMSDEFDRARAPAAAGAFPAVNIWQGADSMAVTAELPGVEADDVDIQVKEDTLAISGERKAPEVGEDATWHRRERGHGRFSRAIRLPYRVDPERVEARLSDGVLEIELHRPEEDKPRRIEIKAA
jgi:HSP20 family protein